MHHAIRTLLHWALAALLAGGLPPPALAQVPDASPDAIAAQYAQTVDRRLLVPASEVRRYARLAQQRLDEAGIALEQPQYLLLVDRSPRVQALLLFWWAPPAAPRLIGASPVSTGRMGQFDYFETPTGVFPHSTANPDFRAEGTYNEHGIRGFGVRGMRVFDFGWQQGRRGWGDRRLSTMRLLLHATDPEQLEARLGTVQSKGCIRIPATLNRLLDQYGLLDADYAAAVHAGQSFWVLSPPRTPVTDAGRYLIVVETQRSRRPAWSPMPAAPRPAPTPPALRP